MIFCLFCKLTFVEPQVLHLNVSLVVHRNSVNDNLCLEVDINPFKCIISGQMTYLAKVNKKKKLEKDNRQNQFSLIRKAKVSVCLNFISCTYYQLANRFCVYFQTGKSEECI